MSRLVTTVCLAVALLAAASSAQFIKPAVVPIYKGADVATKLESVMEAYLNAIEQRDHVAAANLIDDDAVIRVTDINCGMLKKDDLVAAITTSAFAGSSYFIRGVAVSLSIGVFSVESIITFDPAGPKANVSVWQQYNMISVSLTADGLRFATLFHYADRSAVQPNAAKMVKVFDDLRQAEIDRDVPKIEAAFSDDTTFTHYDPSSTMAYPMPKAMLMAEITREYSHMVYQNIYIETAFAACELVVVNYAWGGGYDFPAPNGNRGTNKFFVGLVVNDAGQITNTIEFMLREFNWWPPRTSGTPQNAEL